MNRFCFALCRALGALCLIMTIQMSAADEYPSKPIRIIVPFPAGASADVRTRRLAPLVAQRLKQSVIIENRPGAAGNIGTESGAKSPPDGYTAIFIYNGTVAVNPHLYRDTGFDPRSDLVPVIVMMKSAAILVVNADSPIRSMQDLIAQAKVKPGKLTYGNSGPGSLTHLMGERLKKLAGIDLVSVPYKGDSPALTDLMGGQIDMAFGYATAALTLIEGRKLRALAVTSAKRLTSLPNIPTIAEAGVPGYDETAWAGFAVPAGTPEAIVKKLHEAFRSAMLTPEFKHDVDQSGAELVASTQEYAVQLLKSDYERYGKIVKELGLKVE